MGIHLNLAALLLDFARRHSLSGRVCTLGVQDLAFGAADLEELAGASPRPDVPFGAESFFRALAFSDVEAVDVSDYEGAEHIFDLNEDVLPLELAGRYELVLNGGTLEHVFHVPNALASITRMLRPGGTVVHVLPCHNWVDHGFYQFSPTLMFDYYAAAGFEILESVLVSYALDRSDRWHAQPALPGSLGDGMAGMLDGRIYLLVFAARRGEHAVEHPRPIQRLYSREHASGRYGALWFMPYALDRGRKREVPVRRRIELGEGLVHHQGCCWSAPVPELAAVADGMAHPARSPLVLLEDDRPLGPPHTLHDTIRAVGRGAYSHWGDSLYFSASDNTDPSANGRRYVAVLPGDPA